MTTSERGRAAAAGRTHGAGDAAAPAPSVTATGRCCGIAGAAGRTRDAPRVAAAARARRCARAGVARRRPRRADVQQPGRVPRDLPRLRLARRGGGADQHRVHGPADRLLPGQQRRAAAGDRGRSSSSGWRSRPGAHGAAGDLGRRRRRRAPSRRSRSARADAGPDPPPRRPRRAAIVSRRPAGHPLHLGHHRPGQGRDLPARAVPLVGRQQRARARRRRGDVLVHDAAAVPHQRPQHLRPGVAGRLPRRVRAALLGLGLLAGDARARARPSSTCSARWCRSCWRSPRATDERAHRVRIGLGPGRAGGGGARRFASAPACACSKATARPRPISSSPARPDAPPAA